MIFYVVCCSLLLQTVLCYPTGAPQVVCESMTPHHGVAGQSGGSPYTVKVASTYYKPGTPVNVTIESSGPDTFKGLLIQARAVGKNDAIGSFLHIPTGVKYLACRNPKGAVTHSAIGAWSALNLTWSPPDDVSTFGNISFFATVVKEKKIFWVKLESPPLYKMDSMKPTVTTIQPSPCSVVMTPSAVLPGTTSCPAAKCASCAISPNFLFLFFTVTALLIASKTVLL